MSNALALAIPLGVLAGLGLAGGAFLQHRGLTQRDDDSALTLRQLLSMLRNRTWLAGTALILAGAALHLVGLHMAPVSVMQPLGVLAVPLTVMISSLSSGRRPGRRVHLGVAATVVGVAGFTVLTTTHASPAVVTGMPMLTGSTIPVVAVAILLGVLGAAGPRRHRCLAWAASGSVAYGGATALLKASFTMRTHEGISIPTILVTLMALACLAGGAWAMQQAFASGQPETVVGAMTTIDPVVAVMFGILVLGEGTQLSPGIVLAMAALALLSVAGLLALARHHPDATRRTASAQGEHDETARESELVSA